MHSAKRWFECKLKPPKNERSSCGAGLKRSCLHAHSTTCNLIHRIYPTGVGDTRFIQERGYGILLCHQTGVVRVSCLIQSGVGSTLFHSKGIGYTPTLSKGESRGTLFQTRGYLVGYSFCPRGQRYPVS